MRGSGGPEACDIVYLIHSHKNPDQVGRLALRLLTCPGARVVIHHDEARSHLDLPPNADGRIDIIDHTRAIEWGTFSQAEAIIRSLAWIDGHLDYRWVVFISGQDYPLCSPRDIRGFLMASDYDAFIQEPRLVRYRFQSDSGSRDFWSARYFYAYTRLPRISQGLPAAATKAAHNAMVHLRTWQPWIFHWKMAPNVATRLGVRRLRHPFRDGFRCYVGSDSFTWRCTAVRAVLAFTERRPDVIAYYRHAIHPSESLFNSILMNTLDLKIHFDNLRYDRFGNVETGHPDILRLSDLEDLLASGRQLARKFDAGIDDAILDSLDRHIGWSETVPERPVSGRAVPKRPVSGRAVSERPVSGRPVSERPVPQPVPRGGEAVPLSRE